MSARSYQPLIDECPLYVCVAASVEKGQSPTSIPMAAPA